MWFDFGVRPRGESASVHRSLVSIMDWVFHLEMVFLDRLISLEHKIHEKLRKKNKDFDIK